MKNISTQINTLRDIKLSNLLPIVTLHKINLNKNQKSFTTFKNLVIVWILKIKELKMIHFIMILLHLFAMLFFIPALFVTIPLHLLMVKK